ncbi:MAG: hypothetical protein JWN14_785, partial [Chthonomonadales bacterium]|nr:hypothetical protein [Chthonomonadales bacterium]
RRLYPTGKPGILLHSSMHDFGFRLRNGYDPGYLKRRLRAELQYGLQIERRGNKAFCFWSPEDIRRFTLEHVLLHEIGHHVEYQQRARANYSRWLPSPLKEQFAEDYALRFQREHRAGRI